MNLSLPLYDKSGLMGTSCGVVIQRRFSFGGGFPLFKTMHLLLYFDILNSFYTSKVTFFMHFTLLRSHYKCILYF